jgi:hypothetical protein
MSKPKEMTECIIERTNAPAIKFVGHMIAFAKNNPRRSIGNFLLPPERLQELILYKTKKGNFVCQKIYCAQHQNEHDVVIAESFDTTKKVIDFFGYSNTAKKLYAIAEIDIAITID